jgi:hypothetical protein
MWVDASDYISAVEDARSPALVLSAEDAHFLDEAYLLMSGRATKCKCGGLITEFRGSPQGCKACARERMYARRRLARYVGRAA